MKSKWILLTGLSLILLLTGLMAYDLFSDRKPSQNPYEYKLDKFKQIDSTTICYKEVFHIKPSVNELKGIAVDPADHIYIAASGFILKYGPSGDSLFSFKIADTACCIATGADGKIFVAMKKHIEVYDPKGKRLKKWKPVNEIAWFSSIAVTDSLVFVADAGNKIVHRFNLQGELTGQIGKKDKDKGIPGLFIPSPYFDVLIDKQGQLWAINTGRHAFEAYTFEGELVTRWERTSMRIDGFSGCCNPTHVAALSDGSFVTSEKGIARVKIHDKNGDFKCVVAGPDQFEEGTTGLDLAVDSKDRVLIMDPVKNVIKILIEKNH
jgi:hypothetical protein